MSLESAVSRGERVVVVGAGISGLSATRLLHRLGADVRLAERCFEKIPEDFLLWAEKKGVSILCGEHSREQFEGVSFVVLCPGVPADKIRAFFPEKEPPYILAETEFAWRCLNGEPLLAVTGTSGKTTTTSFCSAMLQEQGLRVFTGGNIGTPLSEYVLSVLDGELPADVLVLELSSFQLQHCSTVHPHAAILLNISENHLDFHKDMSEYVGAKMRLFALQTENDFAILHTGLESFARQYALQARTEFYEASDRFPEMILQGAHNRSNAEAAWLACRHFGVEEKAAARAMANFAQMEHRLEQVAEKQGILYVNDSKSTTIEALKAALEAFDRPILLLAGGKFKGGDFSMIRHLLQSKVRHVALYGGSRKAFEEGIGDAAPISWDATMEQAVHRARDLAEEGNVILLSPATSSFDQYASYAHRGEDFRRIVSEI
ncbi:MAG: UDP-N-acetylmuramoyl-L-alanine--D-glutamate ligase [Desulfovibrionaceae bacterium]|nr:UDP-N-acetylmuramoyl-L-alanine--D-glutamate ligase [Desulfovibrionaceae bacterium]